MKKIIYIVGNPLVEEDSMPLKLAPLLREALPEIEFREFDPTENLPDDCENFYMIDTVLGLKEPRIFTNIDDITNQKTYSMHDFDLGWIIKLYKKMRMIKEITIFGVPEKGDEKEVLSKLNSLLKSSV
jgi:Ni,Fe-hydrogenase maturation factor